MTARVGKDRIRLSIPELNATQAHIIAMFQPPAPSSTSRSTGRAASLYVFLFFVAIFGAARVDAQEFSFLYGGATLPNLKSSTYSWDLDYSQQLARNVSASISWINEGHIIGHHRDGTAAQLWFDLPILKGRYTLSAGAGGYYYFDTQPTASGDSLDVHGTAPIVSFSATAYFTDRWFARFLYNRINPSDNFRSNAALLGVGYWFGRDKRPTPGQLGTAPAEKGFITANEFTVFGGMSVVNASGSFHGISYAAEYRRGLMEHLDGTVSFTYEGDPRIVRRSGLGLQVWPVNTFSNHGVTVGIGLGAYVYIDNKHLGSSRKLPVGGTVNTPALAPLVSPTFSVRLSDQWLVRAVWDRVVTNYNRDSDVFLLGVGYRWRSDGGM